MQITVNEKKETAKLGDLYGIFFEDINHAADGGLYAELVRNRSFEFCEIDNKEYHALTAWERVLPADAKGTISIQTGHAVCCKNPHYLVLDAMDPLDGIGVRNEGYNQGIPLEAGEKYLFSCHISCDGRPLQMEVSLESVDGKLYQAQRFSIENKDWEKIEAVFDAPVTDYGARLGIWLKTPGRVYIDNVSLFPEKTFMGRKNGVRRDIARLLADMHPKFMRFPGGCLIHDGSLNPEDRDSMYRWKNTIGPVMERPSRRNNWGYNQSLGLGYYEFFQFCEDIGAKALPVLPAGYDPHHRRAAPFEQLGEWVQDALDLIEFANGAPSTTWGSLRAEMGHEAPFGLEYIGIGNEEVGEEFFERYPYFHKAIKAKYPEVKIINTAGPAAAGEAYRMGWENAREYGSDFIDEHYYQAPEWFISNHHHYDGYGKEHTRVFLGEYASKDNAWYNALAEASYMIGLERNADSVGLACYAPMLCNADYVNWRPNMIWYDNHRVYATANYYVQKLFMNHQGDTGLEVRLNTRMAAQPFPVTRGNKIYLAPNMRRMDSIMECTEIEIETKDGVTRCKDVLLKAEESPVLLGEAQGSYTIRFRMKRLSGWLGLALWFDCADEANKRKIEYGGWENQSCTLEEDLNGRNSNLDLGNFCVRTGFVHSVEVRVEPQRIVNIIDGKIMNDALLPEEIIEPLYCTASREESSGDIIVKAVNLREDSFEAGIALTDARIRSARVYHMDGFGPDDRNSFEDPEKVAPKENMAVVEDGEIVYTFPAQSINIFRLKV